MTLFVGIASYARPRAFKLSLYSLVRTKIVKGIIAIVDARNIVEKEKYIEALNIVRNYGLEVVHDIYTVKRGFVFARNRVLDLAEDLLNSSDILILYDDDYVCPDMQALIPAKIWLEKSQDIGLVGGRVVDLHRRQIDPDFYLDMVPGIADTLSRITGFVFLDARHGPRYTVFTLPLRALRVKVIKHGVRFDPEFKGTGYRSEDDFNMQIAKLGYKIVIDPRFWAYHLNLEHGGCRIENLVSRFYWKTRNHTYYMLKYRMALHKIILSNMIIIIYAYLHGVRTFISALKGLKDALNTYLYVKDTKRMRR